MRGSRLRVRLSGTRNRRALLIAGIVLVAFNLRPTLASVGPLVGEIRADTGLSNAALGMLTTLPLLAFAFVSNLTPRVTQTLGFGGALLAALVLIATGAGVRVLDGAPLLFGGTVLLGVGIALGNVLLPALVKRDFAHRSGSMTSLYSSVMALGASVAAGLSYPLSRVIGWRGVLALWAIPAVVAIVVWLPQVKARPARDSAEVRSRPARVRLGRSALAWKVAAFMGFQSLTFYVLLAWLPELLQSRGMDAGTAGWMLALSQATGILGSAVVPVLAGRGEDQRAAVWAMGVMEGIALTGLMVQALAGWLIIWVSLIGFVMGGTFGLALLFLVVRSGDTDTATRLSGMAQAIGYGIAAVGPVVVGVLHDVSGGWMVPLFFLVAVWAGKVGSGLGAGRVGVVGGD